MRRGAELVKFDCTSPVPKFSSGSEPLYFVHTFKFLAPKLNEAVDARTWRRSEFGRFQVADSSRNRQNWPLSRYPHAVLFGLFAVNAIAAA
jgi:hypothetical protein